MKDNSRTDGGEGGREGGKMDARKDGKEGRRIT